MKLPTLFTAALMLGVTPAGAETPGEPGRGAEKKNPLKNVYFGEQHLHTQDSFDAFFMGTRNTPDQAYKYAKGERVRKNTTGKWVKKQTAYDWCAVTDHAEFLGILPMLFEKKNPLADTEIGKLIASGDLENRKKAFDIIIDSVDGNRPVSELVGPGLIRSAWERQKKITDGHNVRHKFTTLIAFEWTSLPQFQNLHHNVFFRDEGPDSTFWAIPGLSSRREELWSYQEAQRKKGHENFSIPHNGNLSNGIMFPGVDSRGVPITKEWAERSTANSVATEILQTKGASETHPALSPFDEFAGFETTFKHLLGSKEANPKTRGLVGKIENSYVRQGLINGVGLHEKMGANPYKFGIVSGADSHTAFSVNEEDNFTGVHGDTDDTPECRRSPASPPGSDAQRDYGTAGATGVWAEENTREAIFDAIKRKETFGTSGPLIRLRFFGGWNYPSDLHKKDHFVKNAYAGGVPMGGDLPKRPADDAVPTFAVWALKDPEKGNLDRIQIVKGWYKGGYGRENVYDVVWSDDRVIIPESGKLQPVGNTVDIANASYTNDIGDTQLSAVWKDPDFDPSLHAVYYVRVIEIPTPRWSTYDAKALGLPPMKDVPATIQERAWSSPIWYTPDPSLVKRPKSYPGLR